MRSTAIVAVLALLGLGGGAPRTTSRTRHAMREHVEDLRAIERHLLHGDLELARLHAYMLTRPTPDLDASSSDARELVRAASAVASAPTVEDAIRAEAHVITACATCHQSHALPTPKLPPRAPPDRPTLEAQMARHQWAADRLWEGIVLPSDVHFKMGLYVLANTNVIALATDRPALARRLRDQAAAAYARPPRDLAARATTYGDVMMTCWSCHAARGAPRPAATATARNSRPRRSAVPQTAPPVLEASAPGAIAKW